MALAIYFRSGIPFIISLLWRWAPLLTWPRMQWEVSKTRSSLSLIGVLKTSTFRYRPWSKQMLPLHRIMRRWYRTTSYRTTKPMTWWDYPSLQWPQKWRPIWQDATWDPISARAWTSCTQTRHRRSKTPTKSAYATPASACKSLSWLRATDTPLNSLSSTQTIFELCWRSSNCKSSTAPPHNLKLSAMLGSCFSESTPTL